MYLRSDSKGGLYVMSMIWDFVKGVLFKTINFFQKDEIIIIFPEI